MWVDFLIPEISLINHQSNYLPPRLVRNVVNGIPPSAKTSSPPDPPEWTFDPGLHPGTKGAPIDSNALIHRYHYPQHVPSTESDSVLIKCLPKRNISRLLPSSKLDDYGWGLSLERRHISWTEVLLRVMLFSSYVFLIIWWTLKDDPQGASDVSQYFLSIPTLLLILY